VLIGWLVVELASQVAPQQCLATARLAGISDVDTRGVRGVCEFARWLWDWHRSLRRSSV